MSSIKWIYWEGRLEREWPGDRVYTRERARAESIFLIFFWRSDRLTLRSKSRVASTNLWPQQHGAPSSIFFFTTKSRIS